MHLRRNVSSGTIETLESAKIAYLREERQRPPREATKWIKYVIDVITLAALLCLVCFPSHMIHGFQRMNILSLNENIITLDEWVDPSNILYVVGWILGFLFGVIALLKSWYVGWMSYYSIVSFCQWAVALYQIGRICISLAIFAIFIFIETVFDAAILLLNTDSTTAALRTGLARANSYHEWADIAQALDIAEDMEEWKRTLSSEDPFDFVTLAENIHGLTNALAAGTIEQLVFQVTGCIQRNKLGIDTPSLHLECKIGTKKLIELYNRKIIDCLEYICYGKFEGLDNMAKIALFKRLKRSYGNTALCLSGGGSIGMYHLGVVRALLEADLLPNVVSGSSGGAISAAMLASKTNKELWDDILQEDISIRFKNHGIVWFPPLWTQVQHFLRTGFLVDGSFFERTTKHYYGEPLNDLDKIMHYTFQDAYEKTGRHVSITVSASEITGAKGPRKMLLNHISTPNVFLWSAVAVTCSLPGIMKGKNLMARNSQGKVVPYLSLGEEWIDGSIQHDLPLETMSTCFNLTNIIASQVNPHVVPFLSKDIDRPGSRTDVFRTIESFVTTDIRHRLNMFATLGLFPRIYGHSFSQWFQQRFIGHVTIVPRFVAAEAIGLKAILNPTASDMKRYLHGGEKATWPKLSYIGHLCAIEKCLDKCLDSLHSVEKCQHLYQNWLHPDHQDPKIATLRHDAWVRRNKW